MRSYYVKRVNNGTEAGEAHHRHAFHVPDTCEARLMFPASKAQQLSRLSPIIFVRIRIIILYLSTQSRLTLINSSSHALNWSNKSCTSWCSSNPFRRPFYFHSGNKPFTSSFPANNIKACQAWYFMWLVIISFWFCISFNIFNRKNWG